MMMRDRGAITFGTVVRSVEVSGFILTETHHAAGLILPRHDHAGANLNFVVGGSLRETFGRRDAECCPGSVVVKPPGEAHGNHYGEAGAHCLVLEVTSARLETTRPFADLFNRSDHYRYPGISSLLRQIYQEMRSPDRASPLVIEGLTLQLLGTATREGSRTRISSPPRWLRRVVERLHARPTEAHSLADLAAEAGVHPSYLTRVFRSCFGKSVGGYLRSTRLEEAARDLSNTAKPLAQVAVDAGFYDQSHFSRAFKARYRMTPGEYRAWAVGTETVPGS
jgi:AraC family transcriptional regulator